MQTIPTEAAAGATIKRQARRAHRYRQLAMLHRFSRHELDHVADGDWAQLGWRRTAACGRAVVTGDGLVAIKATTTDDGTVAYTEGVLRCGSVWLCPTCSATIRTHRQMELNAAALAHSNNGGHIGMLTLTVRHSRTDTLRTLQDALSAAWKSLQQSEQWRAIRGVLVGTIAAKEVTYGQANGWHPHLHVLVLAPAGINREIFARTLNAWGRDEQVEVRRRVDKTTGQVVQARTVRGAWAARVYPRLGTVPDHHGFDFRWISNDAASYVAKIAAETTRGEFKTNDAHHAILTGLENGEAWAVHRWREWVDTMPGRRMLVWSRGLRDQLLPDVDDLEDDEVVNQDRGGSEVGTVTREQYRSLIHADHAGTPRIVEVLAAVEAGTVTGLGPPRGDHDGPSLPTVDRWARVQVAKQR
jgi:hypothetical protein